MMKRVTNVKCNQSSSRSREQQGWDVNPGCGLCSDQASSTERWQWKQRAGFSIQLQDSLVCSLPHDSLYCGRQDWDCQELVSFFYYHAYNFDNYPTFCSYCFTALDMYTMITYRAGRKTPGLPFQLYLGPGIILPRGGEETNIKDITVPISILISFTSAQTYIWNRRNVLRHKVKRRWKCSKVLRKGQRQ